MSRRSGLSWILGGTILLGGAAGAQQAPPPRADTIIKIVGAPLHPGIASLREELSFGVPDGDANFMFGEVADIAVAPDGTIVVVDRHGQVVRRYNAQGKFLGTLGRRGQGPGEHRSTPGVAIAADGRTLLWDTANWRVNVFSSGGELLSGWPIPVGTTQGSSSARGLVLDTAGRAHIRLAHLDRALKKVYHYWLRLDRAGTVADSLPEPTVLGPDLFVEAFSPGRERRAQATMPFSPDPQIVFSPHGYFITGHPSRLAFEIVRPGQPIVSIRRPDAKPYPVTAAERDSARAAVTTLMRRVDPGWTWTGPDIPRTKSFYTRLRVGSDGRIWVPLIRETLPNLGSMMNSGGGGGGPAPRPRPADLPKLELSPAKVSALYDVYEPSGVYVGQVQIPPRHVVAVMRGDQLWAVAYDDDDVASVKRYRIVWK